MSVVDSNSGKTVGINAVLAYVQSFSHTQVAPSSGGEANNNLINHSVVERLSSLMVSTTFRFHISVWTPQQALGQGPNLPVDSRGDDCFVDPVIGIRLSARKAYFPLFPPTSGRLSEWNCWTR